MENETARGAVRRCQAVTRTDARRYMRPLGAGGRLLAAESRSSGTRPALWGRPGPRIGSPTNAAGQDSRPPVLPRPPSAASARGRRLGAAQDPAADGPRACPLAARAGRRRWASAWKDRTRWRLSLTAPTESSTWMSARRRRSDTACSLGSAHPQRCVPFPKRDAVGNSPPTKKEQWTESNNLDDRPRLGQIVCPSHPTGTFLPMPLIRHAVALACASTALLLMACPLRAAPGSGGVA